MRERNKKKQMREGENDKRMRETRLKITEFDEMSSSAVSCMLRKKKQQET